MPPLSGIRPIRLNDWMNDASVDAVHGADHRLLEPPDCAYHRVVLRAHRFAEVGRGIHGGQVLSGTKATAFTGDEHGTNGSVGCGGGERVLKLAGHRKIEAVENFGPVQRDNLNGVPDLYLDVLVFHRVPEIVCAKTSAGSV